MVAVTPKPLWKFPISRNASAVLLDTFALRDKIRNLEEVEREGPVRSTHKLQKRRLEIELRRGEAGRARLLDLVVRPSQTNYRSLVLTCLKLLAALKALAQRRRENEKMYKYRRQSRPR